MREQQVVHIVSLAIRFKDILDTLCDDSVRQITITAMINSLLQKPVYRTFVRCDNIIGSCEICLRILRF